MPFSSTSGAQTKRKVFKTVSANANNYVLKTEIGTFTDSIDAFWQINTGIVIGDSGNLGYAANTGTNWSSGSSVYLTNRGTINGRIGSTGSPGANGSGGTGGQGNGASEPVGAGTNGGNGTPGSTGGNGNAAIIFGVKSYVDNNTGTLSGGPGGPGGPGGAGGGGGGGGGSAYVF